MLWAQPCTGRDAPIFTFPFYFPFFFYSILNNSALQSVLNCKKNELWIVKNSYWIETCSRFLKNEHFWILMNFFILINNYLIMINIFLFHEQIFNSMNIYWNWWIKFVFKNIYKNNGWTHFEFDDFFYFYEQFL